ncbi:putative Glucose-methanol-choline (GMC) oxidoreductase family protein [Hibiscus syriacus]|uniref:Glucose-methanol-choline (GMC) oxidoreductase family protein n=1 Tax=Hibiscus syriacus TaxID=106335 RepID=A0A6A2XBT3_HIBSY|nr:putative Glucose-methanol-choline (GMC) oxidoreductase family protein [Hibiscus syriacus]
MENFITTLTDGSPDSFSQPFISEDGVPNNRARALGGGTTINVGFYSRAEPLFLEQIGLDEALAKDSYEWIEKKLVNKPVSFEWQTAVRNGLLEAGVLPDNGFTYAHINGTETSGTIFDRNGNRHTAADLLEYANPRRIKVYLHVVVHKITFKTKDGPIPKADGVIFYDANGGKHMAYLKNKLNNDGDIILSAGAIGSPQLLMLSGIGPAAQLLSLGIKVVLDQPMVGREMRDVPLNSLIVPYSNHIQLSLSTTVGIANSGNSYIITFNGFDLSALSVSGPISKGYLELRNTNIGDNPRIRFNYFQAAENLRHCVQGMQTVIDVVNSESLSRFRIGNMTTRDLLEMMVNMPLNLRPKHPNATTSLEQYCMDTVMTVWHYLGGCQIGKVVDRNFKVFGEDRLRVIDASTFTFSPGTNPQATIMMLGRSMGQRILQSRRS